MKKYKTMALLFATLFLAKLTNAQTQQIVSTAGKEITGTNFQMSYTVGEVAVRTLTASGNIITQGYQQSNLSVTAIEEAQDPSFKINVYPNPVGEKLTINIQALTQEVELRVFDAIGKLVIDSKTNSEKTELDFSSYASGNYLLQLTNSKGKLISAQKIMKVAN